MKAARYNGAFMRYADGGYPLLYITKKDECICVDCANDPECELGPPAGMEVHWEGEPEYCEACGAAIESAYGPVEVMS